MAMTSVNTPPVTDLELLFSGEHMELLYMPGDAPFALVTFDIMHARANGRTGFALKLARKHGIPLFAVVPRRPHWYPHAEAQQVAGIIAAAKDRPTIGYGASMGGYGVLKYGQALRTDATLAFSPQMTIDPAINGANDRRYARFYDPDLNADMAICPGDLGPNANLIFDPHFFQDWFQQDLLKGDEAHRIALPHMGHRAIGTMASSKVSATVFRAALEGDRATIAATLRANRKNTADYYQGLATAAMKADRPALALDIITTGENRKGATEDSTLTRARLLGFNGRADEGVDVLEALVAAHPHQVMYKRFLVDALEQADRMPDAINVLQSALDQSQNAVLAIRMSKLLQRHSKRRAKTFNAMACQAWPTHAAHFGG